MGRPHRSSQDCTYKSNSVLVEGNKIYVRLPNQERISFIFPNN